ncbi:STE family protein kinase [Tritrichomonas foetus]|uniref:STE family protein kinase n=1 Tax=Tritrichomonas foetus TaxID=1144522 RepID=A0A1J4L5D2_9EUKA|nr:STE family protein kinase [Tritrichomonas foetus]|eukprot:OHT17196.1 STE family protein kinase [Tritrichomonas foetus]
MESFPLDRHQYKLLHKVGKGKNSDVYIARCRTDRRQIAIKINHLDGAPHDVMNLRRGHSNWMVTRHPNLVNYFGSFNVGSDLWELCELIDGGSVLNIIQYAFNHGFKDEVLLASILKPVLTFLAHFHKGHHIHRQIRTNGILISRKGLVKVSDLCFSSAMIEFGQRKNARFSVQGATCYTAPEVISESGYKESSDIWSLGIIAIEMATGKAPSSNLNDMEKMKAILVGPPPVLPKSSGFSQTFIDFIQLCLRKNPEKRPSAAQLLDHKFFKNAQDSSYIHRVLMKQLPPIEEMFASLHGEEVKKIEKTLSAFLSCHNWDFDIESLLADEPCTQSMFVESPLAPIEPTVQIGRFKLTRQLTPTPMP